MIGRVVTWLRRTICDRRPPSASRIKYALPKPAVFSKYYNKDTSFKDVNWSDWDSVVDGFQSRFINWYFEPLDQFPTTGHEAYPVLCAMCALVDVFTHYVETTGDGELQHSDVRDCQLGLTIHRDRMRGWFFDPARRLLNEDYKVAAVHLVTPLIEALEEHARGESSQRRSGRFFKQRAGRIFDLCPESPAIRFLWTGARCGFAHHGFLQGEKILIDATGEYPVEFDTAAHLLRIHAWPHVEAIASAYEQFYVHAEHKHELQHRFQRLWYPDLQLSLDMEVVGVA